MVEVYVAVDGSEACLSLNPPRAFCAQKRSRKGDKAGAGLQQVRDIRGEDRRGVPPQGVIDIHSSGQEIREDALGETD